MIVLISATDHVVIAGIFNYLFLLPILYLHFLYLNKVLLLVLVPCQVG